ncbi:amidohydrolase family protein [Flagellimonas olearia]|uniref:Amidohydrolase family protein n=1 Tax=Flagellimonas olearia TaxID=552546 RepID=A0A6I1DZU3_9FLAO|nr:amidohydrolase family protein [Allomuricauda olearia]KAB7530377.1 amidohydrolase family protein [Allomuricauda olearia]
MCFRLIAIIVFLALPTSCKKKTASVVDNHSIVVLDGAKIYPSPSAKPIDNGVVIITNGIIKTVGEKGKVNIPVNAEIINCNGLFMTSGFWNNHIHFHEQKWQNADSIPSEQLTTQFNEMLTRYGFTYAFDISNIAIENVLALKSRVDKGEVKGPHILTTGAPFTPPEGSPFYVEPYTLPEMESPEQAKLHVQEQITKGAAGTKMWSASPDGEKIVYMPLEIGKAGVEAAHQMGKPVFAHPTNNAGVQRAIDCGVDILAHVSPEDRKPWSPEMIKMMISNNMAVIPTLKLYKWDLERFDIETENHPLIMTAIQQIKDFNESGGETLFGMDTGYMTDYDTKEELQLMQQAGMDFQEILTSLTTAPAKRFGYKDKTGKIEPGMEADIVLLSEDPMINIEALARITYTLKKGQILYESSSYHK